MKPKAKKFRVRRGTPMTINQTATPVDATPEPTPQPRAERETVVDDGFGAQDFRQPRKRLDRPQPEQAQPIKVTPRVVRRAKPGADPAPENRPQLEAEAEIAQIKSEGLTGRQLRIARRVAQKHGIEANSDYEAVRLLRHRGIDPFKRENMLQLIEAESPASGPVQNLPATTRRQPQLPSTDVLDSADVAKEVRKIQRDIAQRRRRRMGLLFARLAFFVLLPTIVAGYYYFVMATPMYATKSEFVIQQAEQQSSSAGLGAMFSGTALATTQDAVTVQSYLQSRDAMLRLDQDLGFKAHFSNPEIDPIQRLDPTATNEAAYRLYQRMVKIGYDPTEGIIKMEVIATAPAVSEAFSKALISYAEEQVDNLTQRLREDQMAGARDSYEEAELKVAEAQRRVLDLQEKRGVLSADLEVSSRMTQISTFETELANERLRLQEMMLVSRPNQARVDATTAKIARLEDLVATMRNEMTQSTTGEVSLARVSGELVIAQADLQTRQALLSQSLQQMETARIEANRQVRYLSLGVSPIAPDEATYPRAAENTFLAFMVFAGIYLMISLTASVLREQVSG